MTTEGPVVLFCAAFLMLCGSIAALAQDALVERLNLEDEGIPQIVEDSITGYGMVDYSIRAERSQIISVDLQSSNRSAYFNVLPAGSNEAIFIGSTQGHVADIPAPADGSYVIRVYLMRSAARRGETAEYRLGIAVGEPEFADGLSGGPDFWEVAGVGGGDALNLRAGPSTRYAVIGKLRNGDLLANRGCRLTGEERWCRIRAAGTGAMGWVSGRFIVETSAPKAPATPEGGPVGNGAAFDATGFVACATAAHEPLRQCPFGVVRAGVGNAGVWIALGDGAERQVLFEDGFPVTSNAPAEVAFEKSGDLYIVRIGVEIFEIPEAVIYGG